MVKKRNRTSLSRSIILLAFLAYFINFITDGLLSYYLILNPHLVVDEYQIWRIFTFTLIPSSFEGFVFFILAFYLISAKLEIIFRRSLYTVLMLLLISLQGTLLTIIFWKSDYAFCGMEGLSLFILSIFTLMNYNRRVSFGYLKTVQTFTLTGAIVLSWIFSVVVHYLFTMNINLIVQASTSFLFGLTLALIMFTQIRLVRNVRTHYDLQHHKPPIEIPTPEELSLALISQNELKKFNQTLQENSYPMDEDFEMDEERLNEILDKMNAYGKNSLNPDEIRYLVIYSKNIK
jgi:hypothetical protein